MYWCLFIRAEWRWASSSSAYCYFLLYRESTRPKFCEEATGMRWNVSNIYDKVIIKVLKILVASMIRVWFFCKKNPSDWTEHSCSKSVRVIIMPGYYLKLRTLGSSSTSNPYGRPICLADETFRADSFVQIVNNDLFTHSEASVTRKTRKIDQWFVLSWV